MNRTTLALLAGIVAWTATGCDRSTEAAGTTDDTHSSIFVTGRVFNDQSRPLGAVIVKLRHAGLSDTTDGDGVFAIRGDRSNLAARALASVDTLDYLRDGQVVHSAPVSAWVDTLPDVFLVQRDLSGAIGTGTIFPTSVAGTMWNARGDSLPLVLEWNLQTLSYSGFTWFRYTGAVDSFRVQVRALDSLDRITGISRVVRFTSLAGDIAMPSFDAANAFVQLALQGPSVLARGDTARLRSGATGILEIPASYSWRIGTDRWSVGAPDTLYQVPLDLPGPALWIHFRALRGDGLLSEDSLRIPVSGIPPTARVSTSPDSVAFRRAFAVRFSDSAPAGAKVVRRHLGAPWNVDVSGNDTSLIAPDSIGPFSLVYRVWTDLGDSTTATAALRLVPGTPMGVQASADSSGITVSLPRIQGGGGWLIGWYDSNLPSYKLSWYAPPESGQIHFPRLSASSPLNLTISINGPTRIGPETTLVVETPPLAIDFKAGCSETAEWENCFWLINQPTWATASATLRDDPATARSWLHFPVQGTPRKGALAPGVLPVWGLSGSRLVEMRVRSSAPVRLRLGLDISLLTSTQNGSSVLSAFQTLASDGTTLAWETDLDGTDTVLHLPFDSLKWTDGGLHQDIPLDTILRAAQGLVIQVVCGDTPRPCPEPSDSSYLELADIRFLR